MSCAKALLILACVWPAVAVDFSGASALDYTRKVVAFGPRPPGSPAIQQLQKYLLAELNKLGWKTEVDEFRAATPKGPVLMRNIVALSKGRSGEAVVFSGHYDTKWMPEIRFVGANDAGSSTGLLLEMARALSGQPRRHDVWLVWFDGEEAFGPWSDEDGLYGSRHLAARWAAEGRLERIRALINVDMIGDRHLGILREWHSSPNLVRLIWSVAAELGYGAHFLNQTAAIEDDHLPFVRRGVNAANLIDFDYGPANSYWHTEADTLDKLSPRSFDIVGRVLLEVLRRLEN